MRCALFIFLTLAAAALYGQKPDSLDVRRFSIDSLRIPQNPLDSIQTSFYNKADSLKQSCRSEIARLDSSKTKLTGTFDSLRALQLPTGKYGEKLDSIGKRRDKAVSSLNGKMEELKARSVGRINELDLPDNVKEKASSVTQNIEGFKLPVKDLNIPSLNLPDSPLKNLDGLNTSVESPVGIIGEPGKIMGDLPGLQGDLGDLTSVTGQAGQYQDELKKITDIKAGDPGALMEGVEGKAAEATGIDQLKKQTEGVTPVLDQVQNPEAAKEQVVEKVKEQAMNHFQGKEEQLKAAMEKMSKLKQKYSSLNSLSEITKRPPNPMRGKPFMERLIPGIAIQVFKRGDVFCTDFNLYAGYRFNERLTAGPGWNQRFGYDTKRNGFNSDSRIFGPRIYGEFKIGKGFSPRAEFEVMNTIVPPKTLSAVSDLGTRQWVGGFFAGIKKEFRFIKKVKGTSLIMFRPFNPGNKSPYPDVVNVRFGFEFPMKKKLRKV